MLVILHGDDIVSSRNELTKLKEAAKGKELRVLTGKECSESDLRQAVESQSLFGDTVCVIIENLFSPLGKKEKQMKLLSGILAEAATSVNIFIWEPKELGKTACSLLSFATIHVHKTPPRIFTFLDNLKPHNAAVTLRNFDSIGEQSAPELILYMMETRVRQLIQIKDGLLPKSMSTWQSTRLTNQAKSFTMDKLLAMHEQLIDIEYSLKTGSTPLPLTQLLIQCCIDI